LNLLTDERRRRSSEALLPVSRQGSDADLRVLVRERGRVRGRNQFPRINRPGEDTIVQQPAHTAKQSSLLEKWRRLLDQVTVCLHETADKGVSEGLGWFCQNVVPVALDLDWFPQIAFHRRFQDPCVLLADADGAPPTNSLQERP